MRILLTRRWLGFLALTIVASAVMVQLGLWQWARYEMRHEINSRIASTASPVPFDGTQREWTRVTVTGEYDPHLEILVRNRTVEGKVGFEILTPLLLSDGTAVLIDRGWVAPDRSGITVTPTYPPAPAGQVTVTGRVRGSERDPRLELRDGLWQARRIGIPEIGVKLPYKVAPVYVAAEETELVPVPARKENDWLNLGYAVQWWIFAAGAFVAYLWLARRESGHVQNNAPTAPPEEAALSGSSASSD